MNTLRAKIAELNLADGALLLILALAAFGGFALALNDPRSLALVFGLPLLAIAMIVVWHALAGDRLAQLIVLAVAIFLTHAVFRARDYDVKEVDSQILIRVACWALLALLSLNGLGTAARSMLETERLPWTLLFGYLLFSSIYSPNPTYSAVAASSIIIFYLYFAATMDRLPIEHTMIAILAGIAALAIASLIAYAAFPSIGRMKIWIGNQHVPSMRLSGLAGHANSVGRLCGFGIILLAMYWRPLKSLWRPAPLLTLLLLVVTLLMSNSRTSIAITPIVLAVYWYGNLRMTPYLLVAGTLAALMLIVVIPYSEQIMVMLSRSGDAEEIRSGTSRDAIWSLVEMLSWQKPWLGWGYGSSVFIMPRYQHVMGQVAPHAHNIFLQLWLTTGMIGLALFVLALVSRFAIAVWRGERVVIALLLFTVLNGLTEASAFSGIINISSIALCLAATMRPEPRSEIKLAEGPKRFEPLGAR